MYLVSVIMYTLLTHNFYLQKYRIVYELIVCVIYILSLFAYGKKASLMTQASQEFKEVPL